MHSVCWRLHPIQQTPGTVILCLEVCLWQWCCVAAALEPAHVELRNRLMRYLKDLEEQRLSLRIDAELLQVHVHR